MLEELSSQSAFAAFVCFVASIFIDGFRATTNIVFIIIFAATIIIAIIIISGQKFSGRYWLISSLAAIEKISLSKAYFHVWKLSSRYAADALWLQFRRTDWLLISITVACKQAIPSPPASHQRLTFSLPELYPQTRKESLHVGYYHRGWVQLFLSTAYS